MALEQVMLYLHLASPALIFSDVKWLRSTLPLSHM